MGRWLEKPWGRFFPTQSPISGLTARLPNAEFPIMETTVNRHYVGTPRRNPGELKLELFCRGLRIDPDVLSDEAGRPIVRTRAGLGSGLELVIPGDLKDLWVNAPVVEAFARQSPFVLRRGPNGLFIEDERNGATYPVVLPPEPRWYRARTSTGKPMMDIGVLQGTYLGIYVGPPCGYWRSRRLSCKFCTTGENVGVSEALEKTVEDVVETCQRAKEESGVTFVHFNSGFQGGDRDLEMAAPYVKAVKERVGLIVGVQMVPARELWRYDWLIDLGVDHFSFCFEFYDPEWFRRICPGKDLTLGQQAFFRAMEYTSRRMGKGRVSGEIIAGIEPIEATLRAIDYITDVGAFPTVCVFRPLIGAEMEDWPPPPFEDMVVVHRYMLEACRKKGIPIGIAPNIEVSLVFLPTDAFYLVDRRRWDMRWYRWRNRILAWLARPYFAWQLWPHRVRDRGPDFYRRRFQKQAALQSDGVMG